MTIIILKSFIQYGRFIKSFVDILGTFWALFVQIWVKYELFYKKKRFCQFLNVPIIYPSVYPSTFCCFHFS